ncbi:unnamed protein product [Darwinula stevensoni]|uniref:E3 ubiquitin-protein ligase listerin n=1 Tax=Darwinula stevensoni TaxID=69355 RepID=A0A7R9A3R6_9CRUS|nr:unnamed protein product [Darwinula stevensoni]CAG0892154.1 unnamed protein product [Darwinula stevensoni]
MGGKNQAQRTKGNVKPSSSGRSAELLGGVTGFIGFGAVSDGGSGTTGEELEASAPSEFRLLSRKLCKRDAITKLKALQELGKLVEEKDEEEVEISFPLWPRHYARLALDYEKKVREAVQNCHLTFVKRLGKKIAPHLKSLMPPWIISIGDTHPPAASIASLAFQTAFPPGKQSEALVFMRKELFGTFADVLFAQTPDTLSEPNTSPDEMQSKYDQVVTATLRAVHFVLVNTKQEDGAKLCEQYQVLLRDPKFFKYAKSKNTQMSAFWMHIVGGLCSSQPSLMHEYEAQLCPAVVNALDSDDALLSPAAWEALLHLSRSLHDFWKYVNVNKAVVPRLLALVCRGGKGNAAVIYPAILPLLGSLEQHGVKDPKAFYGRLLDALKQGFDQQCVKFSQAETRAVVTCFFEVFTFILKTYGQDTELCSSLLCSHVIPWINECLTESSRSFLLPHSCRPLYQLLQMWSQAQHETYQKMFWRELEPSLKQVLNLGIPTQVRLLADLLSGVSQPKTTFVVTLGASARKRGVKFCDQTQDSGNTEDLQVLPKLEDPHMEALMLRLLELAYISASADDKSLSSSSSLSFLLSVYPSVASFVTFGSLYPSRNLVQTILPLISEDKTCISITSLLQFLESVLKHIQEAEERNQVFSILAMESPAWLLASVIQEQAKFITRLPHLSQWLRCDALGQRVLHLGQDLFDTHLADNKQPPDDKWKVILSALVTNTHGDTLLPLETVKKLLGIFQACLEQLVSTSPLGQTGSALELICDLAECLFHITACWSFPAMENLLLNLFTISTSTDLVKLESAWLNGMKKLVAVRGGLLNEGGFICQSMDLIKAKCHNPTTSLAMMDKLTSLAEKMLFAIAESLPQVDVDDTQLADDTSNVVHLLVERLLSGIPSLVISPDFFISVLLQGIILPSSSAFMGKGHYPSYIKPNASYFMAKILKSLFAPKEDFGKALMELNQLQEKEKLLVHLLDSLMYLQALLQLHLNKNENETVKHLSVMRHVIGNCLENFPLFPSTQDLIQRALNNGPLEVLSFHYACSLRGETIDLPLELSNLEQTSTINLLQYCALSEPVSRVILLTTHLQMQCTDGSSNLHQAALALRALSTIIEKGCCSEDLRDSGVILEVLGVLSLWRENKDPHFLFDRLHASYP